jgi:hypothetical protein
MTHLFLVYNIEQLVVILLLTRRWIGDVSAVAGTFVEGEDVEVGLTVRRCHDADRSLGLSVQLF